MDPNQFWPGFTFPWPGFSNCVGVRFAQPLDTNIHIWFVSLSLLDQTDSHHSALWTQTNLTWVHFRSAWFLKFYWRLFCWAVGRQHTYRVRFPWPAQPNWLSSLSLVDPNKFWRGFAFPQPSFSNFIGVCFAQPLDANIHVRFVSLGLLDQTDSHHSALWTQTKFNLGSLSLSLISQVLLVFVSLSLWIRTPTYI